VERGANEKREERQPTSFEATPRHSRGAAVKRYPT
jgi:hypothetical protein